MPKKVVSLSTKEDLKIFMSPQRQQLLRFMRIQGIPMTPKALSGLIGISASAVQHHIHLLESLGIVELDHTERINGITARFYSLCDVTVRIGLVTDDALANDRTAIMQNALLNTLEGLKSGVEHAMQRGMQNEDLKEYGDFLSGVVHLMPEQSKELLHLIRDYIDTHEIKGENTQPWEYALILYNAGAMQ